MKDDRENPGFEESQGPRLGTDERSENGSARAPAPPGGDAPGIEDGLELDRMEVRPAEEMREEEQEESTEAEEVEPLVSEEEGSARPGVLAPLSEYWIWVVAFLLGLSAVSAALLFVLMPWEEGPAKPKPGMRLHVVSASLGGEHYVRFNLWGPFRSPKGEEALGRGLPKIRHDLILSGGHPGVARAIQENDLYFLEKHILAIVSEATGIPVSKLDLKGLSVTHYSDEDEVEGER